MDVSALMEEVYVITVILHTIVVHGCVDFVAIFHIENVLIVILPTSIKITKNEILIRCCCNVCDFQSG